MAGIDQSHLKRRWFFFGTQISFLHNFDLITALQLLPAVPFEKSQLHQDLFVLAETRFKRGGFFVEFGAAGGRHLSNTYLLERSYGWTGILAEPAKGWLDLLRANRSCVIDPDCVWSVSGETIEFTEAGELSTITAFIHSDSHGEARTISRNSYKVKTVSLTDLLRRHNAPKTIDYLSIDTEGSEFEILSAFDFSEYDVRIITCEHNYTTRREDIHELLAVRGYVRKLTSVSEFDDWYVRK